MESAFAHLEVNIWVRFLCSFGSNHVVLDQNIYFHILAKKKLFSPLMAMLDCRSVKLYWRPTIYYHSLTILIQIIQRCIKYVYLAHPSSFFPFFLVFSATFNNISAITWRSVYWLKVCNDELGQFPPRVVIFF